MQDNENKTVTVEEEGLNLNKLFSYFLAYWKLFALSFVVCMIGAFVYLYFAVPKYSINTKVLLQDKEKGSFTSQTDMLADFGFQAQNTNVENEIEVINSMSVVRRAVLNAGLNVSYTMSGVNDRPIYKAASPVFVSYNDSLSALSAPINLMLSFREGKNSEVSYSYVDERNGIDVETSPVEINSYPFVLNTVAGDVLIEENTAIEEPEGELLVTVLPLESAARMYLGSLGIAPISKTSSVAILAVTTAVPGNGVDFLNAVIEGYNHVTNEDKRQVALKTKDFLLKRIEMINLELKGKEKELAAYKKKNKLVDSKIDDPLVVQNKNQYIKQLEEIDLMIKASKYLNDFVNNPENDKKVIPTTFGTTIDASLVALINSYNGEVVKRNALLLSATESNPALKTATAKVEAMQKDLRAALEALNRSLKVQRDAIATYVANYTTRFASSPDMQRELLTIQRECEVKSGLYVMLLQKYEENDLSLAVTADNLRCIDAPMISGRVAPNSKMILLVAIFLALAIPSAFIYIKELIRTRLVAVEEIQKLISVPHVGTIPMKKSVNGRENPIVVEKNSNDVMAESFRALRTNLQFVMRKSSSKIIMFTSTTSGEGKTFIASNLAVSTALMGKKVLLVGMDIRRPRLAEMFKFDPKAEGLTSYLAADEKDVAMLDRLILHTDIADGFDILPAGIVPPNPAELLSAVNVERAMEYLSSKYDYIILDTAPVGLVSDSLIISRVADVAVYVVRLGYTGKYDLAFFNSLVNDGKLENVSVVVNCDDVAKKKSYGYSGYANRYVGYGYTSEGNHK